MKKKISLLFLSLFFVAFSSLCSTWTLQGKTYEVDTLFHTYIGPGTTQTSIKLSGAGNLNIFYTTTDLSNEYVKPRVIMAGDKVTGGATVSGMAISHTTTGNTYFAGVNADFFGNNAPIGAAVVDGEIYCSNNNGWETVGIDNNNVPYFGVPTINATVKSPNAGTATMKAFNTSRTENTLALYSKRCGTNTGTNIYGTEVAVMPVAGALVAGGTIKVKAISAPVRGVGAMKIPEGGYVLSGNGTAATYLDKVVMNEEIEITTTAKIGNVSVNNIAQMAGGKPMIVSNGKVLETQGALDHLVSLNPRTAVGYSVDKKKLVLLVVDGRSAISVGVVSKALAEIMIYTGCTEAMNFDGGGSSAIYVKEFGVRNVPSGGTERAVTNGFYLATSTPEDNVITKILFNDVSKKLPKYGYYSPKFFGYNKYGVLINTDVKGVVLSCPRELGVVQNGGATLFCDGDNCHALTATYNGITTTIPVNIVSGEVSFRLNEAIEDTYQGYSVQVQSAVGDETMPLDNQALSWWIDDSSIASIDANGVVKGIKNGETIAHGKVDKFEGAIKIIVQKPTKKVAAIDPNLDPATWTISQVGGQNAVATPLENGMKITYMGKSGRGPYLRLSKKITIWSLPDIIRLRINPGSAPIKKITLATNANGKNATTPLEVNLKANEMNIVDLPTSAWCDAKDRSNYPIQLVYIYFEMGTSVVGTEYSIEIPGIEAVYNNVDASGVEDVFDVSSSIKMYPNPVTLGESVNINLLEAGSSVISIYNEAGQLLSKETNSGDGNISLSTSNLYRGIFFVNVMQNSSTKVLKLIIK